MDQDYVLVGYDAVTLLRHFNPWR